MSALVSRGHVITPKSDVLSIDQKITFEMENIEEKLQRMLQNRADAIDRELQERWPTLPTDRRDDSDAKATRRHCLQPASRLSGTPPTIEPAEPRSVGGTPPSSGRVIDARREPPSLDRAMTALRARVGTSPSQEASWRTRLWAFVSHVRAMPGAID